MSKRFRLRLTIGLKLVCLIATILISAVSSIVWFSTQLFVEDNMALIQQMNSDTAAHQATRVREIFVGVTQKMRILAASLNAPKEVAARELPKPVAKSGAKAALKTAVKVPPLDTQREATAGVSREIFNGDEDFLAFYLHHYSTAGVETNARAVSPALQKMGDTKGEAVLDSLMKEKHFSLAQLKKGEVQIASVKINDGSTVVALGIPLMADPDAPDSFNLAATAVLRQKYLLKVFGESDVVTSYLVDRRGGLLAHPDSSLVASNENLSHLEVVKQLLAGKFNNGQTRYVETQSLEPRLGAFHLVGFGGLGVVAEVPEGKAFEAANRVKYRSMLIAAIVLSVAFLAGYLYSDSITWPIKQLVHATERISRGDFSVKLKPKTRDEVADLSLAFNEMVTGLEERDRVKATFNKFHNSEIAEKILAGEVKLGGEKRVANVFFSDIRGFTQMSESMQPEEVVEMLNEYMTRMVSVIRQYGGVVDKYVGDAIMALWGVPVEGKDDTRNAVGACLAMRVELAKLNRLREERGQPVLNIGMGLNRGKVVAGNIGSDQKMEYTVIGDSVNVASRVESMTKEFGTDLLVSQSVYEEIQKEFIFEACDDIRLKGKTGALKIYRVLGYINEEGREVLVETPYSSYAKSKSDKAAVSEKDAA